MILDPIEPCFEIPGDVVGALANPAIPCRTRVFPARPICSLWHVCHGVGWLDTLDTPNTLPHVRTPPPCLVGGDPTFGERSNRIGVSLAHPRQIGAACCIFAVRRIGASSVMALHRSVHNSMIGGVCGGLAEWLAWDPTLVRVAFVLVSILSAAFPGILVYIVLWMLMPRASQ